MGSNDGDSHYSALNENIDNENKKKKRAESAENQKYIMR